MSIQQAYLEKTRLKGHIADPTQAQIVAAFADLEQRLLDAGRGWLTRFRRRQPVRGLYLWGGVGRGKTFLMDLFFESLPLADKRRIHFHRMMADVHHRLAVLGDVQDPLRRVAADLAQDARVLCFDEFFVSDIGDAMILGRLLEALFDNGVTLVTTSNAHPDDLYRNGLQRSRFLPAIEALKTHTDIVHMDSGTDHRLRLLEQAGTYLSPDIAKRQEKLQHLFSEAASTTIETSTSIRINDRDIAAVQCAKGIVWFDFFAICDGPRSQADYIEIARWYPTVIVSGIPALGEDLSDPARRFIALVDEFYERRVKLILSADAPLDRLYSGEKLAFEWQRTLSRLIEMQSHDYLGRPHLA